MQTIVSPSRLLLPSRRCKFETELKELQMFKVHHMWHRSDTETGPGNMEPEQCLLANTQAVLSERPCNDAENLFMNTAKSLPVVLRNQRMLCHLR